MKEERKLLVYCCSCYSNVKPEDASLYISRRCWNISSGRHKTYNEVIEFVAMCHVKKKSDLKLI